MRKIQRREILITAGGAVFGPLTAIHARTVQAQAAAPRVTWVLPGTLRARPGARPGNADAFRQRLRELGYSEGKNLFLDVRELDGRLDQLPSLMAEIVQTDTKVILVYGSQAVRAAMAATKTIPIVTITVGDVVRQGFAESLARPGKNVTGNVLIAETSDQKPLEILHEMVPGAKRVAFLSDAANPVAAGRRTQHQEAAAARSLTPVFLFASNPDELSKAFAEAVEQRAQMMVVADDASLFTHAKLLVELAAQHRLPTVYSNDFYAALGGLATYSYSNLALHRNAAVFVDRILKGQKPAEIPFEQPTHFELTVNVKVAKTLGLSIPLSVRIRADKLIE